MSAQPKGKAQPERMTPSQLERSYVKYGADLACDVADLLRRTREPGWTLATTGLPVLDELVTIAPQTVTVFSGRPQHGKSLWLKILAKRARDAIEARGGYERGERVFYVTLEEPGSKLGAQMGGVSVSYRDILRGNFDFDKTMLEAAYISKTMRCVVTIEHPGILEGAIAPAISTAMIMRAIERAYTDDNLRPTMIILDYLQLIKADGSTLAVQSKTDHVTAASNGAVRLSRTFNCPVVMAVQAGREVDKRALKVPTMADMQWASSIEQDADTVIGLWRPWVDHALEARNHSAEPITVDGVDIPIQESLMIIGISKARNDPSGGRVVAAHVDPVGFKAERVSLSRDDDRWNR